MVDIDFDNLPAEGKTIDYKRDLSSHKKIVEDAIAFANSAGGKIIIGITDDYEIVGVKDPLLEEERICNILSDSIAPRLLPDVEMVTHNGKTLLILEIFPSSLKPHYVINKGSDDGVVVRVGSTNRKADANLIAELRRTALGGTFDEMPILELLEDEIDADAIREAFGGERKITKRELLSLKLLVNEQGKTVPTKGGIILFGKSRGKYFPDAKVMCGRFRGLDKLDIFDQVVIDTYLPFAIDEIEAFLKKHAYKGAEIEGMRRKDVWSIPLEILREVVINGLVHADYSQRGTMMKVAFYDDRIEVDSPGMLVPGQSVEDMKIGISRIRNNVIARMFNELGLVEQWGSGVVRIFRKAKELNLPEPEILEVGSGIRFVVYLGRVHSIAENTNKIAAAEEEQTPYNTVQVSEQVDEQVSEQVDEQVILILKSLLIGEKSKAELLDAINLTPAYGNYLRHIVPLIADGYIEMTHPDKPRSRLQKYRIMEKGRGLISDE